MLTDGKRISLDELAARDLAKRRADYEAQQAWEQTPEGKAWRDAQEAHHKRMREADERYAAEHPTTDDDETEDC